MRKDLKASTVWKKKRGKAESPTCDKTHPRTNKHNSNKLQGFQAPTCMCLSPWPLLETQSCLSAHMRLGATLVWAEITHLPQTANMLCANANMMCLFISLPVSMMCCSPSHFDDGYLQHRHLHITINHMPAHLVIQDHSMISGWGSCPR